MKKLFACLALLALGACGGVTTSASPTLKPTTAQNYFTGVGGGLGGTVPTGPAGTAANITYNNGLNMFAGVLKVAADPVGSSFGMAQDGNVAADGSFDVVAFSDDGKAFHGASNIVSATVIASSTSSAAGFGQLATFKRDSNSILPTSSTGTFTGDYLGTIGANGVSYAGYAVGAPVAIKGNVTLTANFNNQTVSGVINGRQILLVDRVTGAGLGVVTLAKSSINGNGKFTGTATDGAANGNYYGLIGGANGTGMAGALVLDHGGTITEIGVFTAIRN